MTRRGFLVVSFFQSIGVLLATSHATRHRTMPHNETTSEAASLLLRSSRWSVSAVMDLLEIGDLEFREMLLTNNRLADIVRKRQAGEAHSEIYDRQCSICGELYATATFRTHCGAPACRSIDQLRRR